ncbi:MAG: DUF4159 domain-containing protein [Anaerolineales bacterium]|nr:DUF4159 domain-containing protein [Anaerolineales bacterium]
MGINDLIQLFPSKRLKPIDGLAITSDVWELAHEYHRQSLRFHTILYHSWGIVTGLEVIASDPPDTSIFILPGIAVDAQGQVIILPKPVAYDIGTEMEGMLYLLLSPEESLVKPEKGRTQEGMPSFLRAEFSIAAREVPPDSPYVELARVLRASRNAPFLDADNPFQPASNELDLRYRRHVDTPHELSVAVCYLGEVDEKNHGQGAATLAHTLGHTTSFRITVQDDLPLAPGIENNALIYLVGQGKFKLSPGQINGLANYIRRAGGTLLIESIDNKARVAFLDSLTAMEIETVAIPAGHRLLSIPHLFPAPPSGADLGATPEVLVGEGVILSNANYGRLWLGKANGSLSREHLRSAVEWGQNIIAYAANRYRRL